IYRTLRCPKKGKPTTALEFLYVKTSLKWPSVTTSFPTFLMCSCIKAELSRRTIFSSFLSSQYLKAKSIVSVMMTPNRILRIPKNRQKNGN
ncbi:hypothetical protein, partial [Xanthomarina gelatinilytica]|uniref:hypothetical protein n=1 Tax=Xanthomarina gelatinilytica TaxID=1137281 RepID=UPI001EE1B411